MSRPLVSLLWTLCAFALLGGCINFGHRTGEDVYPSSWAHIRDDFGQLKCPDLTGTYNFRGQTSWYSGKDSYMTAAPLFGAGWDSVAAGGRRGTHFTIKGPVQEKLEIQVWARSELLHQTTLQSPKDFTCYESRLFRSSQRTKDNTHEYGRATDGALVEESKSTDFFMFLIIPMWDFRTSWIRWLPESQSAHQDRDK